MKSYLLTFLILISFSKCIHPKGASLEDTHQYHEIKTVTVKDSFIYDIIDWVINFDKTENRFYKDDIPYGVRLYWDSEANCNVIRVEGTFTESIFLESKDLIGVIEYKNHMLYILENTFDVFEISDSLKRIVIESKQEISDDDRFDIHFFGYNDKEYFRFLPDE